MALEPACVEDFEPYLKAEAMEAIYQFYRCGADGEQTLRDNPLAFQRYRLLPRCLRDVSQGDLSTSVLGHRMSFPVGVSPTACHGFMHPEAEVATAKDASSAGSAMILSIWADKSLENVAAAAHPDTPLLLQINIFSDRNRLEAVIRRAEAAGYRALVVTVDQPVLGNRMHFKYNIDLSKPQNLTFPQMTLPGEKMNKEIATAIVNSAQDVTWKDITWLKGITSLPIVLKGILTAEDAKEAVKHGAAGILVSNHGGRQLDGVPATIDVLAEIVDAVRGSNVEVYLDGGVRRGTDVLKALAMGARAVFVGRPAIWGLAYDGAKGVEKVLGILKEEFSRAMALSGCASLSDITLELIAKMLPSKM